MASDWLIEKTPCYPCEWYSGPAHNGRRLSNATCYYYRTYREALVAKKGKK